MVDAKLKLVVVIIAFGRMDALVAVGIGIGLILALTIGLHQLCCYPQVE